MICFELISHSCYLPRPSHHHRFDCPYDIWWRVQTMELLRQFSAATCRFIPLQTFLFRSVTVLQDSVPHRRLSRFLLGSGGVDKREGNKDLIVPLKPSGNHVYHPLQQSINLHSAHSVLVGFVWSHVRLIAGSGRPCPGMLCWTCRNVYFQATRTFTPQHCSLKTTCLSVTIGGVEMSASHSDRLIPATTLGDFRAVT
jgi:hypothetical protein